MNLEKEIEELVSTPIDPKSNWIRKFESASESAIAGAILHWEHKGSLIGKGEDRCLNRREAASAILQTRLNKDSVSTMKSLDRSTGKLTIVGLILAGFALIIGVLQLLNGLNIFVAQ
ncbi:hypothetical protein [Vibrio vulnificus]|uniref:hypothetical protein n=1 Tax=Vibrio vulnificus TaxID=672 RepID=UPI0009B67F3B|nr:hypothetical protein [Vibrio vulnificus]OQK54978.1 putative membrane protein [Vibrio vulnificus]OQK63849.1 putative membrane protein [Vibrio vulnificus]OQK66183.1 putative membrane protein [Vibrio vulnificus]